MNRNTYLCAAAVYTVWLTGDAYSTNRIVSPSGSDSNAGTLYSPLKTIQKAADIAMPGDTVLIRGGTYREQVVLPRSGTAASPITFKAYPDETVVLSGGDPIAGWTVHNGDIWKATVDWDVGTDGVGNTVFVSGDLKYEARQGAENDLLDPNDWGQVPSGRLASGASSVALDDLIGFGNDYWNGASILIQVQDWSFVTRTIADYVSASGTVVFNTPLDAVGQKQVNLYYIYKSLKALDKPGEWYKQAGVNTLYYQVSPGQNPNNLDIEFRRREYAFDASSRSYIHIEGLTFRGVSIKSNSATDYNVYQDNVFHAYNRGGAGRFSVNGDFNIIRDNEFTEAYETALYIGGMRNDLVNNYIHNAGLQQTATVLEAENATELFICRNTFKRFGRGLMDGYPIRSEISCNMIEDGGRTSWDTGFFDSDGGNGNNSSSIFHHNVLRNCDNRGYFKGFYGRNNNLVIHHNMFYNWNGKLPIPLDTIGIDFRQVYHNTVIGPPPNGFLDARRAIQTRHNNNLQVSLDDMAAIGVDMRGNALYSPADFVDFINHDFRLAGGSSAIDVGIVLPGINDGANGSSSYTGAAPDAGALELGESMWPVGHDFTNKPNPLFNWFFIPGMNLNDDSNFSQGLGDWSAAAGTPVAADFNSWNLKGEPLFPDSNNSLTGFFRTKSVELNPGEGIQRTFTGLKPGTTYTVGVEARIIQEVVRRGDQFDGSAGTISTGDYRGQYFASGLSSGEWIRFDNINFGDAGQYDQIEILQSRDAQFDSVAGATVRIHLDSPGGTLLATFDKPLDEWYWYRQRLELPAVSGVHSIYVSVGGANAQNMAISAVRLLQESVPVGDKLTVTASSPGTPAVARQIGASVWRDTYEIFSFQSGSGADSATINISNGGRVNGYVDRVFLAEGNLIPWDPENIAFTDGIATQSSTDGPSRAELAIDESSATASITQNQSNSWWQVTFPQVFGIGRIELQNVSSASCANLGNFTVSIWAGDPDSGGTLLWSKAFFTAGGHVYKGGTLRISGDEIGADGLTRLGNAIGNVVRLHLNGFNHNGNGVLSLAKVRVMESDLAPARNNLALAGTAVQSSDHYVSYRLATDAINGRMIPQADFTHTADDSQAWWQVDLRQASPIHQIVLVNREDSASRLTNFRVSVWDGDPTAGGTELWGKTYNYSSSAPPISTGSIGPGGVLQINGGTTSGGVRLDQVSGGRFVRVQLNGANFLSLGEVQVWRPDALQRFVFGSNQLNLDLGTSDSPVQSGWNRVSPNSHGDIWWDGSVTAADRTSGGNLNRDFVQGESKASLNVTLTNGVWAGTLVMGDQTTAHDNMMVWAQGQLIGNGINTVAGGQTNLSFQVDVTDGQLNLQFDDAGGSDPSWLVNSLTLRWVSADTDMDGDGMPDWWEELYFNGPTQALATADSDLDGFAEYEEFVAGTLPNDAASKFTIVSVDNTPQGLVLRWAPSVADREYDVLRTSALGSPFSVISSNLVYPRDSYTNSSPNDTRGMYRIGVRRP